MRVLVCGDREWKDRESISRVLSFLGGQLLHDQPVIIHGGAPGADSLADEVGKARGLEVEPFPADWKAYGRAAGPIRNRQMLREGKPDLVLAFHDDLSRSKGTRDMVKQARKAGIPVLLFIGPGSAAVGK